jgi:phosphohistidine phosphatase
MKRLIMIRHAKAEQNFLRDKERSLTEKGKQDAEKMSQKLFDEGYKIDMLVSSSAARAKETAAYFAQMNHLDETHFKIFDSLYPSDVSAIITVIKNLREEIDTLAIVAHNPGVSHFINNRIGANVGHIPACGIAVIEFETDVEGENFETVPKKLARFMMPKSL